MTILLALLGWFLADLFAALIHVVIDNGPERYAICRAFRKHHDAQHDPVSDLPRIIVFAAGATAGAAVVGILLGYVWCVAAAAFAIGSALAQTSHAWSHDVIANRRVPRVVRFLQFCRVFLHPSFHSYHHADPRGHYSVLCGWAEPIMRVFRR